MIPPLKFLPKPTQQQPDNGSRYPRRFLVENTMTTLWFWGFWGSLAPHFIGKCIITGSLAPPISQGRWVQGPLRLFFLHDDLEDSPRAKETLKKTSPQKISVNLAKDVSSVRSHHSLFISFESFFLQVRMKRLVSSPGCGTCFPCNRGLH